MSAAWRCASEFWTRTEGRCGRAGPLGLLAVALLRVEHCRSDLRLRGQGPGVPEHSCSLLHIKSEGHGHSVRGMSLCQPLSLPPQARGWGVGGKEPSPRMSLQLPPRTPVTGVRKLWEDTQSWDMPVPAGAFPDPQRVSGESRELLGQRATRRGVSWGDRGQHRRLRRSRLA